jgi:hypothetical protein
MLRVLFNDRSVNAGRFLELPRDTQFDRDLRLGFRSIRMRLYRSAKPSERFDSVASMAGYRPKVRQCIQVGWL